MLSAPQRQNRCVQTLSRLRDVFSVATLIALYSCGGGASDFVPDMTDFSYGGRRTKSLGTSASGETLALSQFAGRFVWVDYSAPWCGPCVRQAPIIRGLEHAFGNKVVFVTIMTSDNEPMSAATRYTARVWAKQFQLDPDAVVAGREKTRFVPTHGVFSPLGQTLYWQAGLHSEDQIRTALQRLMREWDQWYAENKNSTSVLLSEIGE